MIYPLAFIYPTIWSSNDLNDIVDANYTQDGDDCLFYRDANYNATGGNSHHAIITGNCSSIKTEVSFVMAFAIS